MISFLPFDSKLFGYKIGKINYSDKYSINSLKVDFKDINSSNYDCVYLEIPENRRDLISNLLEKKVKIVGTRVFLMKKLIKETVEKPQVTDVFSDKNIISDQFMRKIAKEIYPVTRFYADPFFRLKGIKLYEVWIRKSIKSKYAIKYFVEFMNNIPVAIVTLKEKEGSLFIDLFCVLSKYRNKGIGLKLLQKASVWAESHGYKNIYVNTQKNNKKALSAYQRNGFMEKEIYNIYHLYK
jgi:dTDP-4-amino-4,6-dideoxy-D-galactose acyltransferase